MRKRIFIFVIPLAFLICLGLYAPWPVISILTLSPLSDAKPALVEKITGHENAEGIQVDKVVTAYRDYNTGGQDEHIDFKIGFKGTELSDNDLVSLINKAQPGLVTFPKIWDAVEIATDDVLLVISKDSQGNGYPLVRVKKRNGHVEAEIINIGGKGSPYNWFPDSRLPGWTRVVGGDQNQYMIRSQPFKIVNLGVGSLAKVDFPFAFLASSPPGDKNSFRVFNLETEQQVAELLLSKSCFQLPGFSFDHPQLDRYDKTEDNNYVVYRYGPKWWDQNFEFISTSKPLLKLKKQHALAVPKAKYLLVHIPSVDPGPRKRQSSIETALPALDLPDGQKIPLQREDCHKVNSNAQRVSLEERQVAEAVVTPAEFCLEDQWPVDPLKKKEHCGPAKREKAFSNSVFSINNIFFSFKLLNPSVKKIAVSAIELEVDRKKYIHLSDSESPDEIELILDFAELNPNQVLFKARGTGPYRLYLATGKNSKFALQFIDSYAYPAGPWETSKDSLFLYVPSAGILIRKNPFIYFQRTPNLVTMRNSHGITQFVDADKNLHFSIDEYTDENNRRKQWEGKIPVDCLRSQDLPDSYSTLRERESWFEENFQWDHSPPKVRQKFQTGKRVKSGCEFKQVQVSVLHD